MAAKIKRTVMSAACFQEAGPGKRIQVYRDKEVVFSQGSPANTLFYIQSGIVMLTTASKKGNKKAVLALLQQGDLFGECCLARQTRRACSATTIGLSTLTRLDKIFFKRELKRNREFADMFIEYLIAQTARFKADLADHFLNFSERRLARILLMHKEFARTSTGAPGIPFYPSRTCSNGWHYPRKNKPSPPCRAAEARNPSLPLRIRSEPTIHRSIAPKSLSVVKGSIGRW